ncbi:MAG: S41 family peptidase [Calditrichales bacterium]|nr:MAG: S41 family peptidase [Calditrichales bacterium]
MKMKPIVIVLFSLLFLIIPWTDTSPDLKADESDYYLKIQKGLKYFQKVYDRVQAHYVEEIDPYEFVKAGIDGMLGALDPYTVFIDQEADAQLRIITTGKYGGVGMEIGTRNNQITVVSPMDNSPAQKSGIQAGDIIIAIDGLDVGSYTLDKISQKLRGPVGTPVEITVKRPGYTGEIIMNVMRSEIVIEDVNYAAYVAPGVAYVRLTGFTDKAGVEMRKAIDDLSQNGTPQVFILDLRGNSGGLLEAAVEVLSAFLPKGTVVVTTKGFRDESQSFRTEQDPLLPATPMAVLVDQGSASASEIVAGALQDLDRAVVVGDKTFGKGLVQKVYNIDPNTNSKIKVTTAKYYTPSGRCVQKQDYASNNALVYSNGADSVQSEDPSAVFLTSNKREVFERGGVTPDRLAKRDEFHLVVTELWRQSLFFNFAVVYHQNNPTRQGELEMTDAIFNEFMGFVKDNDFQYEIEGENELKSFLATVKKSTLPDHIVSAGQSLLDSLDGLKTDDLVAHRQEINRLLLPELAEKYYGNREKIRYGLINDEQLQATLDLMSDQQTYKKILAIK